MTDSLIQASNVGVTYPNAPAASLTNVSLSIGRGDAIGIVGESGSGKSTLARVLVGIQEPSQGQALVMGSPWAKVRGSDRRRRAVQMIFQDPYASLNPLITALDAVAEAVQVTRRADRKTSKKVAEDLLGEVGLSGEVLGRRPRTLSGGQCQRVAIARALACEPEVLIADEPTSALDVSVQAQVLALLKRLRVSHELALVLVSHDLHVVRFMTETCHVLYRGEVVEYGTTERVFCTPTHPYTQALLNSATT